MVKVRECFIRLHEVILLLIECYYRDSTDLVGFLCRVLQLMNLTDSRLAQGGCEKLELAMLSFFEQFRKIYVGDQVRPCFKISLCTSYKISHYKNFVYV
jgi:hypothetical protein